MIKVIKVSASTIEQALLKASKDLNCSCVDLEYEIIQHPSNGIFGIGKKDAKIVCSIKTKQNDKDNKLVNESLKKYCIQKDINEIEKEANELFSHLEFDLNDIEVSKYDSNTILFHFKGEDAALLIGEKGYRYRALSYLLFNWINPKYGLNIRLEIEKFLSNQEEMIEAYLEPIIKIIKESNQPFTTKPFDGILVYIALKTLRTHFPDRYIMIKTNENEENYIVVN